MTRTLPPAFWIALPEGWKRTDHDPEFQQRLNESLRDCGPMFARMGIDTTLLRDTLATIAEGSSPQVVFAADLFSTFDDPSLGALQANLLCTVEAAFDHHTLADNPIWDFGDFECAGGRQGIRRTCVESIDIIAGLDLIGHAEYFIEAPGCDTSVGVRFSSMCVSVWDELLTYFDAIAHTVQFEAT